MTTATAPSNTTSVTLGQGSFTLDKEKAEAAFAAKKVINGRSSHDRYRLSIS